MSTPSYSAPDGPEVGRRPGLDLLDGFEDFARWSWKTLLGLGVVAVVLGIVALLWPGPTAVVLGALFGVYLIVTGLIALVGAFAPIGMASARVLAAITGVLSIVLGVLCLRSELQSIALLGIWIGIGWVIAGVGTLGHAFALPRMPGRGWAIADGVLGTIAGLVLLFWPVSSLVMLTVIAGSFLIVIGIVQIVHAFGLRRSLGRA